MRPSLVVALAILLGGCGSSEPELQPHNEQEGDVEEEQGMDLQILGVPEQVRAGELFVVEVQLLDREEAPITFPDIRINLELEQGYFATGSDIEWGWTDEEGVARFELAIEQARPDYVLTATSRDRDLVGRSSTSEPFAVLATAPSATRSTITGTDGVTNDPEGAAITVKLYDEFGNPVEGIIPEFRATGEGNSQGSCTASDERGRSRCTLTSTQGGEKELSITAPVEVEGSAVTFVWDCDARQGPFGGGDGSSEEPYRICSPGQLLSLADSKEYLGESFVLSTDIDLGGYSTFRGIGNSGAGERFRGNFNGAGFVIRNMKIHKSTEWNIGFIRATEYGSVLENITLEGVDLKGLMRVGGLVGSHRGVIRNCSVQGRISFDQIPNEDFAGGRFGGLVGDLEVAGEVRGSWADVDISGGFEVGGLAGHTWGESKIVDSFSRGTVEGLGYVGGLVGHITGIDELKRAYSESDVTGRYVIGGLIGGIAGGVELHETFATGAVQGQRGVGGLVGSVLMAPAIYNSYSTASAEATEEGRVGSLIGDNEGRTSIHNSYGAGPVVGEPFAGGLVGQLPHGAHVVEGAYWDRETTGQLTMRFDLGEALDTAEFADPESFVDWDFDQIWTIGVAPDGHLRPIFRWQDR